MSVKGFDKLIEIVSGSNRDSWGRADKINVTGNMIDTH